MSQFTLKQFYTSAINNLTLQEALQNHYQINPQFTKWSDYPTKLLQDTMKSHDIMHVIFGCDTSLAGEFRVELLTFFCSNLSFKRYLELVGNSEINKEPFEIIRKIGFRKVLWVIISRLWYIPYCMYISFKMSKKWPVIETESLMNLTIGELRNNYNIKILHKA